MQVGVAGQTYKQVQLFPCLEGAMTETRDMSTCITRRTRACWMRIRWYLRKLDGQLKVSLSLKTRMIKAEPIEALLYGCSTWTLPGTLLLQTSTPYTTGSCFAAHCKRLDHRMASNNRALGITACESIGTTLCARRLLCGRGRSSE